jgi:hypothetical protein
VQGASNNCSKIQQISKAESCKKFLKEKKTVVGEIIMAANNIHKVWGYVLFLNFYDQKVNILKENISVMKIHYKKLALT